MRPFCLTISLILVTSSALICTVSAKYGKTGLRTLKSIGNAQIVSYGAYETRYLRQMNTRYILALDDEEFVDRLIETSINLLACMYGKIYFPTYSNSLKEIGRYLGFEWAWP